MFNDGTQANDWSLSGQPNIRTLCNEGPRSSHERNVLVWYGLIDFRSAVGQQKHNEVERPTYRISALKYACNN